MNDALLPGSAQFISAGPPAFLTLWDRSRGAVRGLAAISSMPMDLNTAVTASSPSIIMQMTAPFASAPFHQRELRQPGIHTILDHPTTQTPENVLTYAHVMHDIGTLRTDAPTRHDLLFDRARQTFPRSQPRTPPTPPPPTPPPPTRPSTARPRARSTATAPTCRTSRSRI